MNEIRYPVYLSKIEDFSKHDVGINFVICIENHMTYDDGYGDSNHPSTSTLNYLSLEGYATEEQVAEWVKKNYENSGYSRKTFKVLKVSPVEVEIKTAMLITKVSMVSGKTNSMEIPVTQEQIDAWHGGELIQRAMPNLTADQREFIKTGVTAEEWDLMFSEEEDDL
jgi:hypothetical protein